MFDKSSTEKVAEIFFKNPRKTYHVREIAREGDISVSTASSAVKKLEEENLVEVEENAMKEVEAAKNQKFGDFKRIYNLGTLIGSGLIDKLEKVYRPDALVLFGSYAEGEDDSNSDIDLAVVNGTQGEVELSEFERNLDRNINIHEVDLQETGENFKTTLANGIVLRGYLNL